MNALTRVLKMNDGSQKIPVPIRVFWPVQDKNTWSCSWEIEWPDRKRANAARGVDGIQALYNALQMVGTEIYCSDAHKSGRLTWAEKWVGYGFPVPVTIRDMLVGNDKESF